MLDIQQKVGKTFQDVFGDTPLSQRLDDVFQQAIDLKRFRNVSDLRDGTGDMLASAIMLATECGWNVEDLVNNSLKKIETRREQYSTLGRRVNVAIFGGAFNPPTLAHIEVAQLVLNFSKTIDEVWFLPCNQHMYGKQMCSAEHRLNMCKEAAKSDNRIKVCNLEISCKLKGETYHTVKYLLDNPQFSSQYNFHWIIGMDNALTFDKWFNYEHLERLIPFIVVPRGNYTFNGTEWFWKAPHMYLSAAADKQKYPNLSSTLFRNTYQNEPEKALSMLTVDVQKYIIENKLF
jgi:nicotinate-nucleotide adenylyltransferase